MTEGCDECAAAELEALRRMVAARDLIDFGLWGEGDLLRMVEGALTALGFARRALLSGAGQ